MYTSTLGQNLRLPERFQTLRFPLVLALLIIIATASQVTGSAQVENENAISHQKQHAVRTTPEVTTSTLTTENSTSPIHQQQAPISTTNPTATTTPIIATATMTTTVAAAATTTTTTEGITATVAKIRPPKEKKHKKQRGHGGNAGGGASSSPTSATTTETSPASLPPKVEASGSGVKISSAPPTGNSNSDAGLECEYEKGPWEECGPNGIQTRKLRLKPNSGNNNNNDDSGNANNNPSINTNTNGDSLSPKASKRRKKSPATANNCELVKIVRRECQLGCKYARGEWSSSCTADGLRVRLDTLIGRVAVAGSLIDGSTTTMQETVGANGGGNSEKNSNFNCPAQRRVTKDCRRACHYIKSAWSECIDGFRTRNLTFDESLPLLMQPTNRDKSAGDSPISTCAKLKQIKRECRIGGGTRPPRLRKPKSRSGTTTTLAPNTATGSPSTSGSTATATTTSPTTTTTPAISTPKLTASQRRRQKLKEIQQRKEQQKSSHNHQTTTSASADVSGSSNQLAKRKR